jgi:hypothetical protein
MAMKSRHQNLQLREDAQKIMDYKPLLLRKSSRPFSIVDLPSMTSLLIYFDEQQL